MLFKTNVSLELIVKGDPATARLVEDLRKLHNRRDQGRGFADAMYKFETQADLQMPPKSVDVQSDAFNDWAMQALKDNAKIFLTWRDGQLNLPWDAELPKELLPELKAAIAAERNKILAEREEARKEQEQTAKAENLLRDFAKTRPVAILPTGGRRWVLNGEEYYVLASEGTTVFVNNELVFGFFAVELVSDKLVFLAEQSGEYTPRELSRTCLPALASYWFSDRIAGRL